MDGVITDVRQNNCGRAKISLKSSFHQGHWSVGDVLAIGEQKMTVFAIRENTDCFAHVRKERDRHTVILVLDSKDIGELIERIGKRVFRIPTEEMGK
jgi:hypothetical protein